ncbi:hypothetical protein GALMADRAFT_880851 [Galerina marginata CBS 339.88]|uniref:Uncharacterized protein n=1 Tax=Galerina marginata (strain CBS 339.88) TaxID=685588 RepID=A0A067SKX5_GALM3|nr:hypothetical protein GALMADRAFT_880851 [Galerina marginata CBS 339.88]
MVNLFAPSGVTSKLCALCELVITVRQHGFGISVLPDTCGKRVREEICLCLSSVLKSFPRNCLVYDLE